jgi:flagellar biosynthetic protein FliR
MLASVADLTTPGIVPYCYAFVLVLARMAASVSVLPGIGETASPATARAGLALSLSLLLLPAVFPLTPLVPESGITASLAVMAEVATGLWFGWAARLWVLALGTTVQYVSYFLGLSNVLQPDADLGPQSTALAHLFGVIGPMIVLTSGMYRMPIQALYDLYQVVPPGSFLSDSLTLDRTVSVVGETFDLSLQLAAPLLVASVIWHLSIGLASRLIPRLQIYFISAPGQIVAGLLLFAAAMEGILTAWRGAVDAGWSAIGAAP